MRPHASLDVQSDRQPYVRLCCYLSCPAGPLRSNLLGGLLVYLAELMLAIKPNFVHPDPGPGRGMGDYGIFVARLSEEKGLQTLLAAWKQNAFFKTVVPFLRDRVFAEPEPKPAKKKGRRGN